MEIEVTDLSSQPVSENGHSLPSTKSVDVFNALSLYNEELGEKYEKEGYNPFDDDFVLTEDYANEILQNKSQDIDHILSENFLDYSNKEVSKNFETAMQKGNKVIEALQNEIAVTGDEKVKGQLKKCLIFVKNRNELLKANIAKLKQKDANAIKMYLEMYGMDSELSEIMKDTFTEEANMQVVISQMINAANRRAINVKSKSIKFVKQYQQAQVNEQRAEQTQQAAQQQAQQQIKEEAKQQVKEEKVAQEPNKQNKQQQEGQTNEFDQDFTM